MYNSPPSREGKKIAFASIKSFKIIQSSLELIIKVKGTYFNLENNLRRKIFLLVMNLIVIFVFAILQINQ